MMFRKSLLSCLVVMVCVSYSTRESHASEENIDYTRVLSSSCLDGIEFNLANSFVLPLLDGYEADSDPPSSFSSAYSEEDAEPLASLKSPKAMKRPRDDVAEKPVVDGLKIRFRSKKPKSVSMKHVQKVKPPNKFNFLLRDETTGEETYHSLRRADLYAKILKVACEGTGLIDVFNLQQVVGPTAQNLYLNFLKNNAWVAPLKGQNAYRITPLGRLANEKIQAHFASATDEEDPQIEQRLGAFEDLPHAVRQTVLTEFENDDISTLFKDETFLNDLHVRVNTAITEQLQDLFQRHYRMSISTDLGTLLSNYSCKVEFNKAND